MNDFIDVDAMYEERFEIDEPWLEDMYADSLYEGYECGYNQDDEE